MDSDAFATFVSLALVGIILLVMLFWEVIFYPTGNHIGYVTAIERGPFCTTTYVKTALDSSQEDTYSMPNNDMEQFEEVSRYAETKQRVRVSFKSSGNLFCHSHIVVTPIK